MPKKRSRQKPKSLSRSKRIVFWLILLSIPVLIPVSAELYLRHIEFGGNLDLVIRKDIGGKVVNIFNPEVTRRYFHDLDSPPTPNERYFSKIKAPGTKRVICLGGSTTQGYPYSNIGGFPEYLEDRLRLMFPTESIEVLNLGISAINSFTVLDLMPEVLELEPDLLIVYMGHNEFYGALGVSSTARLGQSRSIIKLVLKLENWRLFRGVRRLIQKVKNVFDSPTGSSSGTIMARVARRDGVAYQSPVYQRAHAFYWANLQEIIQQAHDHQTAVVLVTIASNLKDMAPFLSLAEAGLGEVQIAQLTDLLKEGRALLEQGQYDPARAIFEQMAAISDKYADAHYGRADCQMAANDHRAAYESFARARDFDALRFRASSELNEIMKQVARDHNVAIYDFAADLAAASPHGIIGGEWMIDHLHLNTDGYFFLAKKLAGFLMNQKLLFSANDWSQASAVADSVVQRLSAVSNFERIYAPLGIHILTDDWPFLGRNLLRNHLHPVSDSLAEHAARLYKKEVWTWTECRQWLGPEYARQGRLELAEKEFRALCRISPDHLPSRIQLGRLLMLQQRYDDAWRELTRALKSEPNFPPTLVEIGIVQLNLNQLDPAISSLQKAITLNQQKKVLSGQQYVEAYYSLAEAYFKKGDMIKARQLVGQILHQVPDHRPTLELKQQMEK